MKQLVIFAVVAAIAAGVHADPRDSPTKRAAEHFNRGVAMYNEADYHAAIVEFRKAYEIAPNARVLYNLGQTFYQLQNYAAALTTFQQYLAQAGDSPSHESEVKQAISVLKSRVGKVIVTTNLPDAEITVDDELAGKTPLTAALDVSIGHRKITALRDGNQPETRYVDVAAGDLVKLNIEFAGPPPTAQVPHKATASSRTNLVATWVVTGALTTGAIAVGSVAWSDSSHLSSLRNSYPVTPSQLDTASRRLTTMSAIGDGLAAAAIVSGAVALYFTLSHRNGHEVRVAAAPSGVVFSGVFQ